MAFPEQQPSTDNPKPAHMDLSSIPHIRMITLFVLFMFIVGAWGGYVYAKQPTNQEKPTITVVGNATVDVQADKALIRAATRTKGTDYDATAASDKKTVDAIKASLAAAGLSAAKLEARYSSTYEDYAFLPTSGPQVSVVPQASPTPTFTCLGPGCPTGGGGGGGSGSTTASATKPKGYISTTSLEIKLEKDELNQLDKYIQVLTAYKTSPYTTYSLSDKQPYEIQAKEKAVIDARQQAERIAAINKSHIGNVLSAQDVSPQLTSTYSKYSDPTQYSTTKTITLTASYQVRYELKANFFQF